MLGSAHLRGLGPFDFAEARYLLRRVGKLSQEVHATKSLLMEACPGCWPGDGGEAHLYAAGDRLPIGIEAFPGREHNDLVLWIESVAAVIPGDTLVDFGRGLAINEWLRRSVTREQVVEGPLPLLALPVQVVLPAHGAPTDRAALPNRPRCSST